MTTNEWDRVCATVFTWRHGHRTVRLNMPAISDVCGGAWQVYWTGGTTKEAGHTRADLIAYCEREGITLPELPEEWCPEPVEEPAKPYSLADDPRLREVVRTTAGECEWSVTAWRSSSIARLFNEDGDCFMASIRPDGRWWAWREPLPEERPSFAACPNADAFGTASNPANAYDEVMAAMRDLGSLVDEEPDADGWIPWGGGECPVSAGTMVEYRLHDGGVDTDKAGELDWDHCDCADIIAYRIISSPEPAEKPDADTGVVQPPTLRDRLLNLSTRMWLDGSPYANELRDLARGLSGGDQ